jgi:hypothetical protein
MYSIIVFTLGFFAGWIFVERPAWVKTVYKWVAVKIDDLFDKLMNR